MKLMCVYDSFAHDTSPKFGDICHVTFVHYYPEMPDGITGYSLQEHPVPWPYRFGAWRKGPGNRLVPNFIRIEIDEEEQEEIEAVAAANSIGCNFMSKYRNDGMHVRLTQGRCRILYSAMEKCMTDPKTYRFLRRMIFRLPLT